MRKKTTSGRGLGVGLIVFLAAFAVCGPARADGSITIQSTSASQARVTIAHPDHWISTQLSPDYRVCWKVKGQWQGICNANKVETDQNSDVYISGLTVGKTYKIKAWCYCAKNNKTVFQWRVMDVEREYTHTHNCAVPCPAGGWYDGANCQVGQAPSGTTAFIWGGNYYYTPRPPVPGPRCPLTGSSYDSVNCFVKPVPSGVQPFIWQNHWYYKACPW